MDTLINTSQQTWTRGPSSRGRTKTNQHRNPQSIFTTILLFSSLTVLMPAIANAQDSSHPKPIPATRQAMLEALDSLKRREPRLPLSVAAAESTEPADGSSLGVVNNARMRSLYLPSELTRRGGRRGGATAGQFPYEFATEIFWIVSRLNNCHYCLGHQEDKLKRVGVSEARLVALDSRWTLFSPREQAAFAFAKKLTEQPHRLTDHDVADLATHYSSDQILELAFLVGRYNATNRWTDALGIPQEDHRVYRSDLNADELTIASEVTVTATEPRPQFSDYATWRQQLDKHMSRPARLQTVAVATESFDNVVGTSAGDPPSDLPANLPAHLRLLSSIPIAGEPWVAQLQAAETVGELPSILRDQIGFVAAREDGAWYMQWYRFARLQQAGMADEQIALLGTDTVDIDPATREALRFATRLTSAPQRITDDDIESLAVHFNNNQIAEIVYHVGIAALLDRLTETAGLVAEKN